MNRAGLQNGYMIRCSCLHILLLPVIMAFAFAGTSTAFQVTDRISPMIALQAWSLPHENSFTFRTWYNEYNPTARVTVYNE
jgi:hypothetical protein